MKESWGEWDEMCQYVKKEIMEYDDNMKIPKYMILRLRGLQKGQFLANNNIKPMASYSSKVILLTFKLKKRDIMYSIRRKDFKDEKHKFNYIMSIIESSINDIYLRCKNKEKQKQRIENIDINVDNSLNSDIEKVKQENVYQNADKKINKRLENLW